MSEESALQKFSEWAERHQLFALAREAVNDVRGTLHQVYFGQPEHMPEPGTPLHPTPQLITAEVTGHRLDMDMGD